MSTEPNFPECVAQAVVAAFAPAETQEAFAVLARTPLSKEASKETVTIVMLGLVKMSKGDLNRLNEAMEYFDPRDAIYAYHGVDWDEELKDARL